MKKILLTKVMLMCALWATAQTLPKNAEGKIEYTEVEEVSQKSASELFTYAKSWAASNELNIKEEDAANQKVVFTGSIPVHYPSVKKGGFEDGVVKYKLSIFCKDGRYKYRYYDFYHAADHADGEGLENYKPKCGNAYLLQSSWQQIKKDAATAMNKKITDMKSAMRGFKKGSGLQDKNDDW